MNGALTDFGRLGRRRGRGLSRVPRGHGHDFHPGRFALAASVLAGDGSGAGGGVSGPQGDFRIEGLRPGTYAVTVVPPQPGPPHGETLELRGDREVVIDRAPRPAAR